MASGIIRMTNDSSWIDVPLSEGVTITSGSLKYRKIGNLVFVDASDMSGITTSGTKGRMPDGFRPAHTVYVPLLNSYPNYKPVGVVRIYGGGNVSLQFDPSLTIGNNWNICFSFVYPV